MKIHESQRSKIYSLGILDVTSFHGYYNEARICGFNLCRFIFES